MLPAQPQIVCGSTNLAMVSGYTLEYCRVFLLINQQPCLKFYKKLGSLKQIEKNLWSNVCQQTSTKSVGIPGAPNRAAFTKLPKCVLVTLAFTAFACPVAPGK